MKKMIGRLRDRLLSEDVVVGCGMILLLAACVLLIAYGTYFQPKWQEQAEKKAAEERVANSQRVEKARVTQAVDDYIRARKDYDLLTEEERATTVPPKAFENWMAEAKELKRREGYIVGRLWEHDSPEQRAGALAKEEILARLQEEPLASREEIDTRLATFENRNGWFWNNDRPATIAMLLAIDIDEYRWLSTMVDRYDELAEQEAKKKLTLCPNVKDPLLSVRFANMNGSRQCTYLVRFNQEDTSVQYDLINDAIRGVVNAGPLGQEYIGGIWMPGDNADGKVKERKRLWYTCYSVSKPQGRKVKQALAFVYDIPSYREYGNVLLGIQMNAESIRIVINARTMSVEALRKLEAPLLTLAEKAGVRGNAGRWSNDGEGIWTLSLMK